MKPISAVISSLLLGFIFGVGLLVSGMVDPANVQGFLDVAGAWRPQLLAVLGTAMMVATVLYVIAKRSARPVVEAAYHWPTATVIDQKLVLGSMLFGAGWALAGYCPGPALVAVGTVSIDAILFVAAMVVGGALHRLYEAQSGRYA